MNGVSLHDILNILRRRKWQLLVPFVLVFSLTVFVAAILPPVYRSTATVLIEEPDVPKELVRSSASSMAEQRMQMIQQKIMSAPDLADMIKQFGLYTKPNEKPSSSAETVDRMRTAIKITPVTAEVNDRLTGRPIQMSIGFMLSFEYGNPVMAQRITNELVSRFLNENLKERRERSSQAIGFLSAELKRLEDTMREQEEKIAEFKARNAGALPEDLSFNQQLVERNERDLTELTRQLQLIEQRRTALRAQLAQVDPSAPAVVGGRMVASPATQLKILEMEYVSLKARYGPDHPDVNKAKREIEALRAIAGGDDIALATAQQLDDLRNELAKSEQRLGPEHPDLPRLRRQITQLEGQLRSRAGRAKARSENINNPAYLQLKGQLDGIEAEYQTVLTQRDTVRQQLAFYRERVVATPTVELEYLALMRDHDNAAAHYKDLKAKTMEAELGQAMERDRKAERFNLIEPPDLPAKPVKPKRGLIVALGFMLAFGGGLGSVIAAEAMSQAIHSSRRIYDIAGELPLATIPYIKCPSEITRRRRKMMIAAAVTVAAIIIGLIIVDQYVIPLDVVQFMIMRKLGLQ
ncbi:MAG TPA: Wzz/FepE/Etk N-terminal domain-containing protein [Azospirillaceae bacterium]|nr:Wzz/FepE/Etk N-terminal domain-containing protein [Azospirillaceae bacterium]